MTQNPSLGPGAPWAGCRQADSAWQNEEGEATGMRGGGDWTTCRAGLHEGPNPSGQSGLSIPGPTYASLFISGEHFSRGLLGDSGRILVLKLQTQKTVTQQRPAANVFGV